MADPYLESETVRGPLLGRMPMKVREVVQLLERDGWKETRSRAATDIQTSLSGQPGDSARQRWQRARAGHRLFRVFSGRASAGDTDEGTRSNFREALAAHFEAMREIGESIPEPTSLVDYVEVAA